MDRAGLIKRARGLPPIVPDLGIRVLRSARAVHGVGWYLRDWRDYRSLPRAEPLRWRDALPKLGDRVPTTPFDRHYFFQDVWAARHVAALAPQRHVDVGSRVDYVGFLTAFTEVTFVDIRPPQLHLDRLKSIAGSALALPFEHGSVNSLSCLNVAEHIGLGRYGDTLNPMGTREAATELQRVLAPGGQLLFSLPVGRPRVLFNSHRIHDPHDIVGMFEDLQLVEIAGVDDDGVFACDRMPHELACARYACGMFRFVR